MRRCGPPGVLITVDDGEARVRDVVAAVDVDGSGVRGGGDVEGEAADECGVWESDGAGDEGKFVRGDAGACLEEAPSVGTEELESVVMIEWEM